MTRDDIRLLYEYDRWANRRVLKAASTLSDEQFTRAMNGSFHCVRDTLLHILGASGFGSLIGETRPIVPHRYQN